MAHLIKFFSDNCPYFLTLVISVLGAFFLLYPIIIIAASFFLLKPFSFRMCMFLLAPHLIYVFLSLIVESRQGFNAGWLQLLAAIPMIAMLVLSRQWPGAILWGTGVTCGIVIALWLSIPFSTITF